MTPLNKALFGLTAIMFAALMGVGIMLERERKKVARATIEKLNVEARLDSTTAVSAKVEKLLGDSLVGVTRLALQIEQQRDKLDRALGAERSAIAGIRVEIRALRAALTSIDTVVESPEGSRSATFGVDSTPFRGSIDVTLPRPPARGSLRLGLSVDPAPISLRLGCLPARSGDNGIRRASAALFTPPWLTATIDSVSQEPEICNRAAGRQPSRRWPFVAGGILGGAAAWWIRGQLDRERDRDPE